MIHTLWVNTTCDYAVLMIGQIWPASSCLRQRAACEFHVLVDWQCPLTFVLLNMIGRTLSPSSLQSSVLATVLAPQQSSVLAPQPSSVLALAACKPLMHT
jgi:hypothetical protein